MSLGQILGYCSRPPQAALTVAKGAAGSLFGTSSIYFGVKTASIAGDFFSAVSSAGIFAEGIRSSAFEFLTNGTGAVASAVIAVWLAKGVFCPGSNRIKPPGFSPPNRRASTDGSSSPRKTTLPTA